MPSNRFDEVTTMIAPEPLTTFHLFPHLPLDLRTYIYTFICPELGHQQVLEFVFTLRPSPSPRAEQHHALTPSHCSLSRRTVPIRRLLSICRESRELALRHLPDTLEFPPAWKPKPPSSRAEGWIHRLADEYDEHPVGGIVRFKKERDLVFLVPWHHSRSRWATCGSSYLYVWDPSEFSKGKGDSEGDGEDDGESGDIAEDDEDEDQGDTNHPPRLESARRVPIAVFDLAGFAEHVRHLVVHISTVGPLEYMYGKEAQQPWNDLLGCFTNLERLYLPVRAVKSKGYLARPNWRVFVSPTAVDIRKSDPEGISLNASSWPRSYEALSKGMKEEKDRLVGLGLEAKMGSEHLPRLGREYKEWVVTKVPRKMMESGKRGDGKGCQVLPVVLWRGLYQIKWLQQAAFEIVDDDLGESAWWLADRGGCPAGIFE